MLTFQVRTNKQYHTVPYNRHTLSIMCFVKQWRVHFKWLIGLGNWKLEKHTNKSVNDHISSYYTNHIQQLHERTHACLNGKHMYLYSPNVHDTSENTCCRNLLHTLTSLLLLQPPTMISDLKPWSMKQNKTSEQMSFHLTAIKLHGLLATWGLCRVWFQNLYFTNVPFSSFSIILNHSWNGSLLLCIFMCGLGRGVQGASPRSASKGDLIEICIPNVDFNASISWGQFTWLCFVGEVQSQ